MKKRIFIKPGDRFNRLTAIKYSHTGKHYRRYFIFKCDCGKETIITAEAAISGNTKSCGCLSMEIKKKRISEFHSELTAIILGYKRHAKDRGFTWGLSREEVENIIKKDCEYCGTPPSNIKTTKNTLRDGLKYSGIDRIDSKEGYHINNIVPCCKICNYAKSSMDLDKFHQWAIRIGKRAMADQWGIK